MKYQHPVVVKIAQKTCPSCKHAWVPRVPRATRCPKCGRIV